MSRRTLLAGVALLPLAACTTEPAPPPPDPDDLLREQAVARERSLLAAYDAVLLAQPALSQRLAPLRAEHVEHLLALTGPPPTRSPSPSPSGAAPPPAVPPPTAAPALAGLVTAEQAAGGAHAAAAVAADSWELAGLLASLAASERSHPVVLT